MSSINIVSSLFSTASMSIVLLGFSAVASVFHPLGADGRKWIPDGRFWSMSACALATFLLSLFPLPLISLSLESETIWYISSIMQAIVAFILIIFSIVQYKKNKKSGKRANIYLFFLLLSLLFLVFILALYNFINSIFPLYFSGMIILLGSTAWLFVRVLYVWLQ